jgi:regulator of protease activity HflC (stomatin/prohibitin superfamily)
VEYNEVINFSDGEIMEIWYPVIITLAVLVVLGLRIVQQYEKGVIFRLGRVVGVREPGLRLIIPLVDVMKKVNMRIITMPVAAQKVITKDNVSIDVSAVAYYQIMDPVKSLVAIDNVMSATNQIAQTTLRNVVGQHELDEILAARTKLNQTIEKILDAATEPWGVKVNRVELKDMELPETMQRAMARQAEAEREKRAKIVAAEGEFLSAEKLGKAADIIAAHPVALQLRNLQVLSEIATEKNSTIVFPAQFMDTVKSLKEFVASEK